jgi:RNA polymerase sigma factor (TIGR02999 family)
MPSSPVTELLQKWRGGDQSALESLIPLVYQDLREIAHRHLQNERRPHTLQGTALVHEVYIRLAKQQSFPATDRAHFLALASRVMRQILVDYARNHQAVKRGADQKVPLDTGILFAKTKSIDVLELNDALSELAELDEQQSRIVELRFFGGLTNQETAEVLCISTATVKRDWSVAKSWLTREMKKGSRANSRTVEAR